MEVLGKLTDAASMFWSALDERERMMVLYFVGYVALMMALAFQRASRERLKAEIREELAGVHG